AMERVGAKELRTKHFIGNRLHRLARFPPAKGAPNQQHSSWTWPPWPAPPVQDAYVCAGDGIDAEQHKSRGAKSNFPGQHDHFSGEHGAELVGRGLWECATPLV